MRDIIDLLENADKSFANAGVLARDKSVFLHASKVPLPLGTILKATGANITNSVVEELFESVRPPTLPSRLSAVYMAQHIDVIEVMGLDDGAGVYFVRPSTTPMRFDAKFVEKANDVLEKAYLKVSDEMRANILVIAEKYWSQKKTNVPIYEYLAQSATVVGVYSDHPSCSNEGKPRVDRYGIPLRA